MHEDNEKCNAGDKRDADKIQADSEPAHGAAEEVVGGLVGVQQLLISAGTREIKSQHILADSEEKRKLGKKKYNPLVLVMLHCAQLRVSWQIQEIRQNDS